MQKRRLFFIVLLVFSLLLSGCWSRKELNEIAMVSGFGIDKVGDDYIISAQVVDPSEIAPGSGGGRVPVMTYKTKGKSLMTTIRKLSEVTPRKLYFSHLRMLVIGETAARTGIAPVLDFLSRDPELRTDFNVIMTKGDSANEVLSMVTPLEKVPSEYMFTMLEFSEKFWSPFLTVKIDQLDSDISSPGKQPVLSVIEIRGKPKEGEQKKNVENIPLRNFLQYTRLGVFKQDKFVGFLNQAEGSGYNYVVEKTKSTAIELPCSKGQSDSVELTDSRTIVRSKVTNHQPSITIRVDAEANVAELQCPRDLLHPNAIKELQKETEKVIESQIRQAVQTAQKYHSDIFGFGEKIHQYHAKEWKRMESNWDDIFTTMPIHVDANVVIRNFGKINQNTPIIFKGE